MEWCFDIRSKWNMTENYFIFAHSICVIRRMPLWARSHCCNSVDYGLWSQWSHPIKHGEMPSIHFKTNLWSIAHSLKNILLLLFFPILLCVSFRLLWHFLLLLIIHHSVQRLRIYGRHVTEYYYTLSLVSRRATVVSRSRACYISYPLTRINCF